MTQLVKTDNLDIKQALNTHNVSLRENSIADTLQSGDRHITSNEMLVSEENRNAHDFSFIEGENKPSNTK